MNDSDPRPMPPEVQRAYRDPLKLTELLDSHAYSEADRLFVRDELLRALVSPFDQVHARQSKHIEALLDNDRPSGSLLSASGPAMFAAVGVTVGAAAAFAVRQRLSR